MYCSACGTALAPGLSYCNRCGLSLKEQSNAKPDPVGLYLASITTIGIAGLALMLGGAIALRNGALFRDEMIGIFMLMTFLIVAMVELSLCRQLSRITKTSERQSLASPNQAAALGDFRPPQPRALAEPVPSVTENTTRTLEYSRNEPLG